MLKNNDLELGKYFCMNFKVFEQIHKYNLMQWVFNIGVVDESCGEIISYI